MDKKLSNDTTLKGNYDERLSTHLSKSNIEPVKIPEPEPNKIWYIPIHSIQNANKLENFDVWQMLLRSILDSYFNRTDLVNNFLVILLSFCEQPVAILADIESMIMQIAVKKINQHFNFCGKKRLYSAISVHSLDFWCNIIALNGNFCPKSVRKKQ